MKVLLVNGSPHKEGCTYTALKEVEKELINSGIETEIIWLGIHGDAVFNFGNEQHGDIFLAFDAHLRLHLHHSFFKEISFSGSIPQSEKKWDNKL